VQLATNTTLHMCWLIDPWKPSREQYLRAWQAAGWQCVLWHSGQIEEPPVPGVELRCVAQIIRGSIVEKGYEYERQHRSHAGCADLFRYQVLHELGGAYADLDVLPGEHTTPGLPAGPLFGLAERGRFEIRFIRAPTHHPLLLEILQRVVSNQTAFMRQRGYSQGYRGIPERTGPVAARPVVERYAKLHGRWGDYVLPNATIDGTEENIKEGHALRIHEILSAAQHQIWSPLWSSSLRWRR
jgi:hypothetical protein